MMILKKRGNHKTGIERKTDVTSGNRTGHELPKIRRRMIRDDPEALTEDAGSPKTTGQKPNQKRGTKKRTITKKRTGKNKKKHDPILRADRNKKSRTMPLIRLPFISRPIYKPNINKFSRF